MRFHRPIVAAGLCLCVIASHARDIPRRTVDPPTAVRQLSRRETFHKSVSEFGWMIAAASLALVAVGSAGAEWMEARGIVENS